MTKNRHTIGTFWYILTLTRFYVCSPSVRHAKKDYFCRRMTCISMENLETIYASLRTAVEKAIGRKLQTPRDFDYLSFLALDTTKQYVSAMTLKRFWGYFGSQNKHNPRLATLNILSQIAGYMDWGTYYSEISNIGNSQSAFLNKRILFTSSLDKGTIIQLKWHPNRKLLIRHDGYEVFTVIASENSKLSVGDTFRCEQITEGQTMTLGGLIHEGLKFPGYVCGLEKGVVYEIMDSSEATPFAQ